MVIFLFIVVSLLIVFLGLRGAVNSIESKFEDNKVNQNKVDLKAYYGEVAVVPPTNPQVIAYESDRQYKSSCRKGNALLINKDYSEALAAYKIAIRIKDTDPFVYNRRGLCYYYLGKFVQAIEDYNKAISLAEEAEYFENRGKAYYAIEDDYHAYADWVKAVDLGSKVAKDFLFVHFNYVEPHLPEFVELDTKDELEVGSDLPLYKNIPEVLVNEAESEVVKIVDDCENVSEAIREDIDAPVKQLSSFQAKLKNAETTVGIYDSPPLKSKPDKVEPAFEPNDRFLQYGKTKEYPIVNMPVKDAPVLLPSFGKIKTKGFSENKFKFFLLRFFAGNISTNSHLKFQGATQDYEPDFIFSCKERGLYIDIEIDEPYSGCGRKPMHFVGSYDIDRDQYFTKNGWVVIRFTEEQIIKQPESCCFFVACVVDSLLNASYSKQFNKVEELIKIRQWTYEEALSLAADFYREGYLNVRFNCANEAADEIVEAEISSEKQNLHTKAPSEVRHRDTDEANLSAADIAKIDLIKYCIKANKCLRFSYSNGAMHLVKPVKLKKDRTVWYLMAFDYIHNVENTFEIRLIEVPETEEKPFLYNKAFSNLKEVQQQIDLAVDNQLYIRFEYVNKNLEGSVRTVGNFDYTDEFIIFGYSGRQFISGYCFKRNEDRTFKLERIRHLTVLNLAFS